jgi:pimeloyl-ACP methyl ester carboxylesterase
MGDELELTLADGRQLGYTTFGDPSGQPCLVVPGFNSSRLMPGWAFPHVPDKWLIAVDRPGYGHSTPHPGFTSWANDAAALLTHLAVDRVSLLATSMGAAPAYALAATHPTRVVSTTILGGMGVVPSGFVPPNPGDAMYWRLARRAPWLLRRMCGMTAMAIRKGGGLPGDMDDVLTDDIKSAFTADVQEACRQGGRGMADDLLQYLRPWGFLLADVRGPVYLWHGTEDPKVPVELARRVVEQLPDVTAHFVPGGHFAALAHQDKIFAEI